MLNSFTRAPSWLTDHWRGAALIACAIGAIAALRWNYDKDPERKARMQEKDLHALAEKISKYARELQTRFPTGTVVVSVNDLATELHRGQERISTALGVLQSQEKAERVPLSGYWKLNV
jgi:hypothetical protein